MFLICIFIVFVIIYLLWLLNKLGFAQCRCSQHLVGKVAIITGSNTGIGFANAKDFAERGAKVILACRSEERGTKARDAIIAATGNYDVYFYRLDLSSFSSVREFVKKIEENENRLDILVNNAGDVGTPLEITKDRLLFGMQVNYFGPFLLTNLLLPVLKKSAPSRIVNVASLAYKYGTVKLENLNDPSSSSFLKDGLVGQLKVYKNAKLCTILATQELARKLQDVGVTVNALCPGTVRTNILNKIEFLPWKLMFNVINCLFAKDWYEGAQTQIYLSVSPEVKNTSGCYFTECKKRNLDDFAKDPIVAKRLWEVTESLVNLK